AIPDLMEDFDVLLTSTADKLFYDDAGSPKLGIEWNESSNMLDVSFETEDMSTDDLRLLMKQLNARKKFVRLTNGKLVHLNTDAFRKLGEYVDQLDLHWQDINKENAVPVYKGLALSDKEEINQGRNFRELVSRLFSPEKLDFSIPSRLEAILRPYQET